jgi:hypothetical protein
MGKRWQYLWFFHTVYALIFLSCRADQGNYTAVNHNGHYLYGVWHAHTAKAAENLSRQIATACAVESPQIKRLPIITIVKSKNLLPKNGEAADWVRSREPSTYTGQHLYKDVIGGNAGLYHSYGFVEGANVEYQTPKLGSKPLILVEIFDMGTPENAFGRYSFDRYPQDRHEWVGSKAILSGDQLTFCKGKYFIQIEGYEFASAIKDGMKALARVIANHIKDAPDPKPLLLKLLPQSNQVRYSAKYFLSDSLLRETYRFLPENVLKFGANSSGVSAMYPQKSSTPDWSHAMIAFVIQYETEPDARGTYEVYQGYLHENATVVNSTQAELIAKE